MRVTRVISLRDKLPEGCAVRIVRSDHPWLEPGMEGVIHWNHDRAVLPQFQGPRADGTGRVSVLLVSPRDKVERQEAA